MHNPPKDPKDLVINYSWDLVLQVTMERSILVNRLPCNIMWYSNCEVRYMYFFTYFFARDKGTARYVRYMYPVSLHGQHAKS